MSSTNWTMADRISFERDLLSIELRELLFHFPVCNPQDNEDQPCDDDSCAESAKAWELWVSLNGEEK